MVATRHCCWGKCNNDSRYPERLPDSLKEMLKNGQKAFVPFPKPKHDLELCQRWVNACSRQNVSVKMSTTIPTFVLYTGQVEKDRRRSFLTRLKRIYQRKKYVIKRKGPKTKTRSRCQEGTKTVQSRLRSRITRCFMRK